MMKKRIWLVICSMLMMLMLGTVYSYSMFRGYVEQIYEVGSLVSGIPYMLSLFFYAVSMMIFGRIMKPSNLQRLILIGVLFLALGWFIASISTSILMLSVGYGFFIGISVGIIYGIPLYVVQKTFLNRPGLYTGLILLGFGMSPLITAPIGRVLLDQYGLFQTFKIFGIIFPLLIVPISFLFKLEIVEEEEFNIPKFNLKSDITFRYLYIAFLITTTIGLMMIGLSYQVGVTYYQFDQRDVTFSLSLFALFNGLARPLFGSFMDKYGFYKTSILSIILILIASLIGIMNQGTHYILYLISFGLFWFNLGAWLAIIPNTIKSRYGKKAYARIYGYTFTAYGFGAIIGTLISGSILDVMNQTNYIYISIIVLVTCAYLCIQKIKSPKA